MVDAAVAHPGTSAAVVLRFIRSEGTVDTVNNRSYLYADLYLKVTASNGAGGPFKTSPASSAYLNSSLGALGSWSAGYDLRPASGLPQIHLVHWEGWVAHDADGKKTVTFSFGFSGAGGTPLGSGSGSDSIVLTAISRNLMRVKVAGVQTFHLVYAKINGVMTPVQPAVKDGGTMKLLDNT